MRIFAVIEKGRVSIFLFINGTSEVYHVHCNIGQSQFDLAVEKLNKLQYKYENYWEMMMH